MKSSQIKCSHILYYSILALAAFLVLSVGWRSHERVNFTHETLYSLQ
jgi:hypothetical protein